MLAVCQACLIRCHVINCMPMGRPDRPPRRQTSTLPSISPSQLVEHGLFVFLQASSGLSWIIRPGLILHDTGGRSGSCRFWRRACRFCRWAAGPLIRACQKVRCELRKPFQTSHWPPDRGKAQLDVDLDGPQCCRTLHEAPVNPCRCGSWIAAPP